MCEAGAHSADSPPGGAVITCQTSLLPFIQPPPLSKKTNPQYRYSTGVSTVTDVHTIIIFSVLLLRVKMPLKSFYISNTKNKTRIISLLSIKTFCHKHPSVEIIFYLLITFGCTYFKQLKHFSFFYKNTRIKSDFRHLLYTFLSMNTNLFKNKIPPGPNLID